MSTSSTLMTLTPELRRDILDLLPYPTLQVLHATHFYFSAMVDLEHKPASVHPTMLFTQPLTASLDDFFRRSIAHYTCTDCLRLRPGEKHSARMKRKHWFRRYHRLCIDCSLDHRYAPGIILRFDQIPATWCKRCKEYNRGHETVMKKPGGGERLHSLLCCKHCMISELWLDMVVPTGGMIKTCHLQYEVGEEKKIQAWHRQAAGEDVETRGAVGTCLDGV